MSDIGPGAIVQRLTPRPEFGLAEGALYRVRDLVRGGNCVTCGLRAGRISMVLLVGRPDRVPSPLTPSGFAGLCICGFAPWPPPPSEILLSEDVDTDVKEPV